MINLTSDDIKTIDTELLVVPVCENESIHVHPTIKTLIKKTKKFVEFSGKDGDEFTILDPARLAAKRVLLLGIGKLNDITQEKYRTFAGRAINFALKKKIESLILTTPSAKKTKSTEALIIEGTLEGACLANWIFDQYKKDKKIKPLKNISIHLKDSKKYQKVKTNIQHICTGTLIARTWVSTPSNDKRPETFAKAIETEAKKHQLKTIIFDEKKLKDNGFGGILAVGQGSDSNTMMIGLEYTPSTHNKTIALIGKGVTFDSGGINLKPSTGLEGMKMDMAGAAAVYGTMLTVAKLKPKIKVIGLLPLVENMPSGNALRPGDIIKSYSGKTIEIGNTDAEGRLILMDAMSYAVEKYNPDFMVDIATLTGACMVALGDKIAGVFTKNETLNNTILQASKKTHERCWSLPLPKDYSEMLKSEIADTKNIAGIRYGGAIMAALFLAEFAKNTNWAHIDIAGPAFSKKETPYCPAGGTGFGVRLLWETIHRLSISK